MVLYANGHVRSGQFLVFVPPGKAFPLLLNKTCLCAEKNLSLSLNKTCLCTVKVSVRTLRICKRTARIYKCTVRLYKRALRTENFSVQREVFLTSYKTFPADLQVFFRRPRQLLFGLLSVGSSSHIHCSRTGKDVSAKKTRLADRRHLYKPNGMPPMCHSMNRTVQKKRMASEYLHVYLSSEP